MNTSDERKMSAAPKSGYAQTTIEDPAQTLANIKIPRQRLEKAKVEVAPPQPDNTLSEGSAASASSSILKIEKTIHGVKINVRIFKEPALMPARPDEVVQKE